MASRVCFHCKQPVTDGDGHDCWTTTEAALTRNLSEDLRDAWDSIMFARKACYLFVRPKRAHLELCVFLGRPLKSAKVKKPTPVSRTKFANIIRIVHRDEVEAPITEWMREAYDFAAPAAPSRTRASKVRQR